MRAEPHPRPRHPTGGDRWGSGGATGQEGRDKAQAGWGGPGWGGWAPWAHSLPQESSTECPVDFPAGSDDKASTYNVGDQVQFLGREDLLENEMATHSSILDWNEPGRLQSMGSQRVGHD